MQNRRGISIEGLLPKNRFDSIADLDNEVKHLDNLTRAAYEQDEIRKQIDEVMKEFGYNISQSIILDGVDKNKAQNYLFESDSDDMSIHLSMSDSNMIMLSTVLIDGLDGDGHDGYDGIVEVKGSDAEQQELFRRQTGFCGTHSEIIAELKKRGVVINIKKLNEVGAGYAKLKIKGKTACFKKQADAHAHHRHKEQKHQALDND